MPDWRRLPWQLAYIDGPRQLSRLRRLSVLATHRHARVSIAPSAWLGPRFALFIPDHGTLTIGEHVQFRRGTSLEEAHRAAHELQDAIESSLDGADVLIHIEPEDRVRPGEVLGP